MASESSETPDEERLSILRSRPYQRELLEKAKEGNTIVYLGTGSGKTFIAIMLIREMRGQLKSKKKAIFLVNSVALVDQQAEAIRISTGLSVGSYCGADGVDSWTQARWSEEISAHQVLVLVHQVFLDVMTHSYFSLSNAALLILDECHHAQMAKNHPYSSIMREWYHKLKQMERPVPKILGLSACLVVKTVTPENFHKEKNNLENIMDSKVETTEDLYSILQYVTNPDEEVLVYERSNKCELSTAILDLADQAVSRLEKINTEEILLLDQKFTNKNTKQTAKMDLKKDLKLLKNDIFRNISDGIENLGLISLQLMLGGLQEMVRRQEQRNESVFYGLFTRKKMIQVTRDCFAEIVRISRNICFEYGKSNLSMLKKLSSRKVLKLTDQLKNDSLDGALQKRAIVFVEQKFTAESLCRILEEFARLDGSLSHMTPDFAYSPGSNLNCKDPNQRELINQERKKLKDTLAKFKAGSTNTIVSTSVIEEGLDVRSCNLVIKFDFPQTFRSYVQSKGRARAKPSQYILMVSETDQIMKRRQYQEFQEVEQLSLRECHFKEHEESVFDSDSEPPYLAEPDNPESARINGSQALQLVYKYIQKVPVDRFTRLTPVWVVEKVIGSLQDDLFAGLGASSSSGYVVTCHMPHKTPFTAPVRGPVMPDKKLAKRSTALQICRLLHEYEELDNRLKVKKREVVEEDEDDEDVDEYNPNQRKTGTKRKRRFYLKEQIDKLKCEDEGPFFLHAVKIKLFQPNVNLKYSIYHPEQDEASFGLLTSTALPDMGPFELHSPSGIHTATISYSKQVPISFNQLSLAKLFHQYIFTFVLKLTNLMNFKGKGLLLVPLRNGELDLQLLNRFLDSSPSKKLHLSPESKEFVIYPTYKKKKEHYFIEEIISFMNIKSQIPGENNTFEEYFLEKYGKELQDKNQPLLRISSADKRPYMLIPTETKTTKKHKKDLYNTTLFMPELMGIERISAGLWKQAQMLPLILHRTSSLISASKLLEDLSYKVSPTPLILDKFPESDLKHLFVKLLEVRKSSNPNKTLPSTGNILQALTLKAANDCFDMERLEVLGDVFLKFSTGVFLYYKSFEQEDFNGDEGDLTTKRSKIVGNKNLFKIAENLDLAQKMVSSQMEPHSTWISPGYEMLELENRIIGLDAQFDEHLNGEKKQSLCVGSLLSWLTEEDLGEMESKTGNELLSLAAERCVENKPGGIKMKNFKLISDKSQADCVEALIGCFLLNSDQTGALEFMAKIGIDLSANNSSENVIKRVKSQSSVFMHFSTQPDAFCDDHVRLNDQGKALSLYLKLDAQKLESIIGYTFKEKSFLLQAFTHASYGDNRLTESYEKLEYLGDAVLDYLVTAYIFTHTRAGPGRITDIRSALVNNNMFASIIVQTGLHPYILHYTPMLQNKIQAYIEDREKDRMTTAEDEIDRSLGLINEVEPPELEMVEVPKVLGDVFESLIGAVYIDSGHDLMKVWEIYSKLCPQLNLVLDNPPVNMKKQLMEKFPSKVTFTSKPNSVGKVTVSAKITIGTQHYEFRGLGMNKALATVAACKLALRKLN